MELQIETLMEQLVEKGAAICTFPLACPPLAASVVPCSPCMSRHWPRTAATA